MCDHWPLELAMNEWSLVWCTCSEKTEKAAEMCSEG